LENKKSRCLIVALNIERNNLVKGVDDEIQKCITLGQELKIPVIHVSTRAKLGRAFTGKFGPRLSIISIVNWEGYQDYVDDLMGKWSQSCEEYKKLS
jgi:ribosomal protein L7Ae-like RNA K-turn-binding protein